MGAMVTSNLLPPSRPPGPTGHNRRPRLWRPPGTGDRLWVVRGGAPEVRHPPLRSRAAGGPLRRGPLRSSTALLRGETVTYEGRHYRLSGARLRPRPVQSPRPPFMVAAHQPRMLRLTARYADGWNSSGHARGDGPTERGDRRGVRADRKGSGRDIPFGLRRPVIPARIERPVRPVVEPRRLHRGDREVRRGRDERVHSQPALSRAVPGWWNGSLRRLSDPSSEWLGGLGAGSKRFGGAAQYVPPGHPPPRQPVSPAGWCRCVKRIAETPIEAVMPTSAMVLARTVRPPW